MMYSRKLHTRDFNGKFKWPAQPQTFHEKRRAELPVFHFLRVRFGPTSLSEHLATMDGRCNGVNKRLG
jgi:hypothetical protein